MSKHFFKTILIVVFVVCVTLASSILYYTYRIMPEHTRTKEQLSMMQGVMNSNLHIVYVAARDLSTGDVLRADDIVEDSQYITDYNNVITAEDVGKILITDIPAGSTIPKAVVTDVLSTASEWLVEYGCFRLTPMMTRGSFVDIRIRFQNGEDYVVLAKKQIQNIDGDSCYLAVDTEEMHMMASAIVDANLYNASLYTTLYTKPTVQDAVPVTYLPNFSNPDLYKSLYNERNLQLRREMIGRISDSCAIDASNTNNTAFGGNVDNTSKVSVQ